MDNSPYGPDRSLPLAIGLLVGGLVICGGGMYALSELSVNAVQRTTEYAGAPARPSLSAKGASRASRGSQRPPSMDGTVDRNGVPGWARWTPRPAPAPRPSSESSYEIDPNFGHAELGTSATPSGASPGAGAMTEGGASSMSGAPDRGGSVPTADLGGKSVPTANDGWRSEASTLNRRVRALEGALAGMDRANRSSESRKSHREENRSRSDADASTASTGQGSSNASSPPGTPDDPPQVPVDGGLGWLAAAGAAYAANRLRKKANEDDEDEA